mgnify:FL=1
MQSRNKILKETGKMLNAKWSEIPEKLQKLMEREKEAKKSGVPSTDREAMFLFQNTHEREGIKYYFGQVNVDKDALKNVGDKLLEQKKAEVITLWGIDEDSIRVFVWVEENNSTKVNAGNFLKQLLTPLNGKGGGKPHFAQGGVADISKATDIIREVEMLFSKK